MLLSSPCRSVVIAATILAMLGAAGCGGSDAVAPRVGPPAQITVIGAPAAAVVAGEPAGTLAVRVTDKGGSPIVGAAVTFTAGSAVVVDPGAAQTDAAGEARTVLTAGTVSGGAVVIASVASSNLTARVTVVVTAGPAVQIVVSPKLARIFYVGDTIRFTASALDQYGNRLPAGALSFVAADPSLLFMTSDGLATALRQDGVSAVIATAGPHSDSASVTVTPAGVTPCSGVVMPTALAVGEVATLTGATGACVAGGVSGAEYALVVFNADATGSLSLSATVLPTGVTTAPTAPLDAAASLRAALIPLARGAGTQPHIDESFHVRLRERSGATVRSHAQAARQWYGARRRAVTRARAGAFDIVPAYSAIPAAPQVGDIVRVNVNALANCSSPIYNGARVVAVGTRAIVLADTLNPANGFSDADYARFATRFDTLVYPLDASAFGEPSDIDGNGKVAVFFTRAVNELTAPNASAFVAGFFYSRDLLPATGAGACVGSNEGELLYMLVPDSAGVVNGNVRRRGFVDSITTGVLAHEMQHLISSSRRLFVNQSAETEEVIWLNEGLSHIAEELLYYRESGRTPRANLGDAAVRLASADGYSYFKADLAANFSRLISYLGDPASNSPVAMDDELATRGATWSFLRYAADRLQSTDGDLWSRFDNSTASGMATLQAVYGGAVDLPSLFRDWALANLLDDAALNTDARFTHPSWNFRNLFATTFGSYDATHTVFTPLGVPLRVTSLTDGVNFRARVRGLSASYYRLAVRDGREALLTFSSTQGAPSPSLQFLLVRTR